MLVSVLRKREPTLFAFVKKSFAGFSIINETLTPASLYEETLTEKLLKFADIELNTEFMCKNEPSMI